METDFQKFVLFTFWGEGLPIAYKLQQEGYTVVVGMIKSSLSIGDKEEEDKQTKDARMSQYDGLLTIYDADKLVRGFSQMPQEEKDSWFVIFDFNNQYELAVQMLQAGFKNGLFPTKLDFKLEEDRNLAKEFVVKNYPSIKVAEVEEFKSIDDGIIFLQESEEFWALKGNDAGCGTVVPQTRDCENAKQEIIDALTTNREGYERKGFILERQIRDGIEVCPQAVFWNGALVATSIDVEDKNLGSCGTGAKFGCSINVIMETPIDCDLNKLAFPEAVYKLAKRHKGLFIWDANLILKDGEFYYLEFCANRMGYDAIYAEMDMSGGAGNYFNAIARGECPYERRYGAGVRSFSFARDDDGSLTEGKKLLIGDHEDHVWFFGFRKDGNKLVRTKGSWGDCMNGVDVASFTGSSDDYHYAVEKAYKVASCCSLDEMYYRGKHDFMDHEYPYSPHNRIHGIERYTTSLKE